MPPSDRISLLARKISAHIRVSGLVAGTPLPERRLAELFDMSRSPIKQALKLLADHDVVSMQERGGYVVGREAMEALLAHGPEPADEAAYMALARDHLAGTIPNRVSENELIRRYGLTRHQVARMLHRAAHEGWVERLPGHGWRFLEVLTSAEVYAQGYRYRILVEPAGILDPGFVVDRAALLTCRTHHVQILEGDMAGFSPATGFDVATEFHSTVMRCSNNTFFIDGLTRLTRLRRLIEYRKSVDRGGWAERCAQHIHILDLLLAGDRPTAAQKLREHLQEGAAIKTIDAIATGGGREGPSGAT